MERIGTDRKIADGSSAPTRKQLAYLAGLAERQRGTYAVPATAAEASAEIKRLLGERRARARRRRKRKQRS